MKDFKPNIPPFELEGLKIRRALIFGSVVALASTPNVDILADDDEAVEEIIVTASKR